MESFRGSRISLVLVVVVVVVEFVAHFLTSQDIHDGQEPKA